MIIITTISSAGNPQVDEAVGAVNLAVRQFRASVQ